MSVSVNGKSDSSTTGDAATLILAGHLPYYFSQNKDQDKKVAIVGLGTGLTAGSLGLLNHVSFLEVPEISPGVIEAQNYLKDANFGLIDNSKIKIFQMDAFRFFAGRKSTYDFIVSEPTNPWVVGVENLFTQTFYRQALESLKEHGIFGQWFHIYDMGFENFLKIIGNLKAVFPQVHCYFTLGGDVLFLGVNSHESFIKLQDQKFDEKFLKNLKIININDPKFLPLLEIFNNEELDLIVSLASPGHHSLEFPTLALGAYKDFYKNSHVMIQNVIDPHIYRRVFSNVDEQKISLFVQFFQETEKGRACPKTEAYPLCMHLVIPLDAYRDFLESDDFEDQIQAYKILRKHRLIAFDSAWFKKTFDLCESQEQIFQKVKCFKQLAEEAFKDNNQEWMNELKIRLLDLGQHRFVQQQMENSTLVTERIKNLKIKKGH